MGSRLPTDAKIEILIGHMQLHAVPCTHQKEINFGGPQEGSTPLELTEGDLSFPEDLTVQSLAGQDLLRPLQSH